MGRALRVLDLFSAAAGGWSLGLHRAGFRTVYACEAIAWRRALYAQNNPGVFIHDDVRTLTADRIVSELGYLPDIVVGSPPCQDISPANTKGKGVEGSRSGLYFEAVRIIGEVRPRWFAFENSANLRTRGADAVVAALEALGYTCWAFVVRASDIGANHERARSWIIGCDPEQVCNAHDARSQAERWLGGRAVPDIDGSSSSDPDGIGRDDERRRGGFDLSVSDNPQHAASIRHEGGRPWRYGPDGDGAAPIGAGHAANPNGRTLRFAKLSGGSSAEASVIGNDDPARNTTHSDQARQAHGCLEPGLRQAEIADDGCGAGRGDDGSCTGQMGLCAPDCGHAVGGGPLWSLGDLADHLWLDDGLSARLAGTRVALGDGRGASAASLVVEAFGDAVVPQIPEAIGRAILRVEAAMMAVAA